jgi:hypothetical protein
VASLKQWFLLRPQNAELVNGQSRCKKRARIRRHSSKNQFGEIDRRQGGDVILRSITPVHVDDHDTNTQPA